MRAAPRALVPCGRARDRPARCPARLGHGFRRSESGRRAADRYARPPLFERDRRARQSHQRAHRALDLGAPRATAGGPFRHHREVDVHLGVHLSRRTMIHLTGREDMRIVPVRTAGVLARAFSVAAVAAAMGCSSLTVNTDWNTTIDFTQYKTWNFKVDTLPYSTFTQARIRQAIANEMMNHGVTRDTLNPQLLVVYRINLSSQTQVQTVGYGGYGYGPAWGGYGGYWGGYGGVGVSTTSVTQIPPGALTLAMVDTKLNQLV